MEIEFYGAAREVTGSCHLLRVGGKTILLDCGLFQGHRTESEVKNRLLPFDAKSIHAVVLSHAHIDHAGRLPFLVRSGFRGPIYTTPASRDLSAYMLSDSAHIQAQDIRFHRRHGREARDPLYDQRDVDGVLRLMRSVPYDEPTDIAPGLRVTFVEAGHILGSASVVLECEENGLRSRVVFSGDVGRPGLPILRDPQPPRGADLVIMESTYGDREHPPAEDMRTRLAEIIRDTSARGGRVIVPSFAVGRTQDLVYDLHRLSRDGKIPEIPIYVDSPLAIDATSVYALHPEIFDSSEDLIATVRDVFHFPMLHYTRDVSESKALNTARGPMVIIAASGMAENGRIVHHLANNAANPRNTILIVGFQAANTLGRRIVERQPNVRIFGEEIPLRAEVAVLNGYSAHAGRTELASWLDAVANGAERKPRVRLVHGETGAQQSFMELLRSRGYEVEAPARGDVVTFGHKPA